MTGDNWNCQIDQVCPHRTVETRLGENERSFEMYVTLPGAGEVLLMAYRYTRG